MKAIIYRSRGPASEVLIAVDLPKPDPLPGEVLVRVVVSAVNPSDTKARGNWLGATLMPYPQVVPHQDGSGVIEAVGAGVPSQRVGQRVWLYMAQRGSAHGTAAEYVALPAWKAVPLPTAASFAEGAMMGIPAMTAHYALYDRGPIGGKTVLVQGGAGAVGFYAIQLAKLGGAARVIATVSKAAQEQRARLAGADAVLFYNCDEPVEAIEAAAGGPNKVDIVVEVALGANLATDVAVLAPGGVIASFSSDAAQTPLLPFGPMLQKDLTLRTLLIYHASEGARAAATSCINDHLATGALQHQVARTLPLAAIVQAHESMETGLEVGKLLLQVNAENSTSA